MEQCMRQDQAVSCEGKTFAFRQKLRLVFKHLFFISPAAYRKQNCWARLCFCPDVQNMDAHTGRWRIRYITDITWQKWPPFPVHNSNVSHITAESVAAWQNLQWPFTSLRGGSPPWFIHFTAQYTLLRFSLSSLFTLQFSTLSRELRTNDRVSIGKADERIISGSDSVQFTPKESSPTYCLCAVCSLFHPYSPTAWHTVRSLVETLAHALQFQAFKHFTVKVCEAQKTLCLPGMSHKFLDM